MRALAERLGRSEPEMPSISVPLAHEQKIERYRALQSVADQAEHAAERDRRATPAAQSPGEHITRVLGERPGAGRPAERQQWDRAAEAIERYRDTHNIDPAEATTLGPDPRRLNAGYEQIRDWEAAGEQILHARERLGISPPGLGTIEERLSRIAGIMPQRDIDPHRDIGRGR